MTRKRDRLPYTSIFNAGLGAGLTKADVQEMPWGQLVLTLQARAQEFDEDGDDEVIEASPEQIFAYFGI